MNSRELEFVTVIEQEYLLNSTIPSYERVDTLMTCTRAFYQKCLEDEEVQLHLRERGIPINRIMANAQTGALSPEQLICINTLLDFNDTRSDKKKLESLGITSAKFATWKKDPGFQDYLRNRAENLFGDNLDEVHRALLDNARSGDISSIKLIYQLTGRFDPNAAQIDARTILTQVFESITRHVKDPAVIQAIGADFELIVKGIKVIDSVAPKQIAS